MKSPKLLQIYKKISLQPTIPHKKLKKTTKSSHLTLPHNDHGITLSGISGKKHKFLSGFFGKAVCALGSMTLLGGGGGAAK